MLFDLKRENWQVPNASFCRSHGFFFFLVHFRAFSDLEYLKIASRVLFKNSPFVKESHTDLEQHEGE